MTLYIIFYSKKMPDGAGKDCFIAETNKKKVLDKYLKEVAESKAAKFVSCVEVNSYSSAVKEYLLKVKEGTIVLELMMKSM